MCFFLFSSFLSYSSRADALTQSEIRDSLIRALYTWQQVTPLTFHEVHSGEADIYIMFARGDHYDGYAFDGPGK